MNEEHVTKTMEQLKSLRYRSYSLEKPWLDAEGHVIWSRNRMTAARIVFSQSFETCMGIIILANLVLIIYEANEGAKCFPDYLQNIKDCPYTSDSNLWLYMSNVILLLIFSVECLFRAYVERGSYLWNKWNLIDLFTVLSGWVGLAASNAGIPVTLLRMFRLVRVVRALRFLISVPEFYLLITGLYSSIKAIVFGALMLVSVITFWAVISVEVLHPITSRMTWEDCDRCPDGFRGIFAAALTLFQQIVAGDSWGTISIPLVETAPWTAVLLFSILITISLGMLNLILAVIVERAAEARENDHEAKIKKKNQDRSRSMEDLATLCASMDENNNGMISYEELLKGYDEVGEFKRFMDLMDLKREDMGIVFNVLDTGNTQEVPYLEFCQHLGNFFKRDPVIMHSLVKYSVMELRKLLEHDILHHMEHQSQMLRLLLRDRGLAEPAEPAEPTPQKPKPAMKAAAVAPVDGHGHGHGNEGLSNWSNLSQELQVLEAELQPLLAKAQEVVDSIAVEAREDTIDIDQMAIDVQFHEISQRFQARISDAQRLQDRCSRLLQAPQAPEAPAPIGRDVHHVHRAPSPTARRASNAINASNSPTAPTAPATKATKANGPGCTTAEAA